ncbi:uncharacterized protein LOC129568474 [Sitodiplosis mosellana]|uniref:uncharacterized protein LOC129568474 n=1 Tax=Sitodiplosis mosellana TaxID=263140 RepID=UPI00244416F8|nr:uncharacterized protein LOC129568474 [Sitodiplosis mosellana]
MARYIHFYRKSLTFAQIFNNGPSYSTRNVLFSTNKYLYNTRGFHTFGLLNNEENNEKNQSSISIKQLYRTESAELNDIVRKVVSNVQKDEINAAIEIYNEWNQKNGFDDFVFLTLVNGLLKCKRIDEAKQIVTQFDSNSLKSRSNKDTHMILCSIFDSLSDHSDLNDMIWFVDNLIFSRKHVNRRVLEIIIKNVLRKHKDVDATFNLFDRIAQQFHVTPLSLVLTCELIKLNDIEKLEKLLEIISKLHGQVNGFYDMAFAFTICGRIDQAKRIFCSLETQDSNRFEYFINNLKLRRQVENLRNLLAATANCVSKECRANMYSALLELCAYEHNPRKIIANVCSAMNEEQIIPTDESIQKIRKLMKRTNSEIPKTWIQIQPNTDNTEVKLQALLNENNIQEANTILYDSLNSETPIQRNIMRYCLLRNAESGSIAIFDDLKLKFDSQTKIQLKFYTYECAAYIKAGKSEEYMKIIRNAKSGMDSKELAVSISERVIDMIESNPNIYEEYKDIALNFADKDVVKPICLAWIYNFVNNKNTSDNEMIWNTYLKRHPTIVCNQVTKILFQRNEGEKLRVFLNLDNLNKKYIAKSELGKAYSSLFDNLFYKGDYDTIIEELHKAILFLSLKDFKSNTLNRIKLGPDEFSKQFWSVINNSGNYIQSKK